MIHQNYKNGLMIVMSMLFHMAGLQPQMRNMIVGHSSVVIIVNGMNQQRRLFIGNGMNMVIFLLSIFRLRMDVLQKKC